MTIHDREELDREGRIVRGATAGSLMSDTKWRKVFSTIEMHPELELRQRIFKFVGYNQERTEDAWISLSLPHPWIDTFAFGPIPLRSIEWMLFPRVAEYRMDSTIPPRRINQDVKEAMRIFSSLGQLPLEMTERGLLIRGYLSAK